MHFPGSWHDETWLAQFPSEHLAPLVSTMFSRQTPDMGEGTSFKDPSQHTYAEILICVHVTQFPGIDEGETKRTN